MSIIYWEINASKRRRVSIKFPLENDRERLYAQSSLAEDKNSSFDIAITGSEQTYGLRHTVVSFSLRVADVRAFSCHTTYVKQQFRSFFTENHISNTLLPYPPQIEREWTIFSGHAEQRAAKQRQPIEVS